MTLGMRRHSDTSFDESKEISILKLLLESKRSIKTFFGENDKTPNHDGFFELVDTETKQPTKQFIVQIKKGDVLHINSDGSRSFLFDTAFLFYVKARVTENPAIIFVVELSTLKCFYKYLSDDYLAQLNFEGKANVTLRFHDKDQITNVDVFYKELRKIVAERNQKLIKNQGGELHQKEEKMELVTLLKNMYPITTEYIDAFREGNQSKIIETNAVLVKDLQRLYYYFEINVYKEPELAQFALEICNQFNIYGKLYNTFINSDDIMSEEAQQTAEIAEMKFRDFVFLIIKKLAILNNEVY